MSQCDGSLLYDDEEDVSIRPFLFIGATCAKPDLNNGRLIVAKVFSIEIMEGEMI